jgi:hypothetical protein
VTRPSSPVTRVSPGEPPLPSSSSKRDSETRLVARDLKYRERKCTVTNEAEIPVWSEVGHICIAQASFDSELSERGYLLSCETSCTGYQIVL